METVMNILKAGKTAKCVTIDEIETKEWNYFLPTFCSTSDRSNWILKSELIAKNFFTKNHFLNGIDMDNVLIAGGSVAGTITQKYYDDIDLFIYGLDDERRNIKLTYLINAIAAAIYARNVNIWGKHDVDNTKLFNQIYTIRNQNCVTLRSSSHKVQIILRKYESPEEILNGFDLGSSAIGILGRKVILTSLAKFAYEYGYNIIDTTRRSTTYESRLDKYFQRGFGIIMPHFAGNVAKGTRIEIHNLKFLVKDVIGMKYLSYCNYLGNIESDYQFELDYSGVRGHNMKLLRKGETDTTKYYYTARGMDCAKVISDIPFLTSTDILEYFNSRAKMIFTDGKFNVNICEKVFKIAPLLMFAKILNNPDSLDSIVATTTKEAIADFNGLKPSPLTWREGGSQVSGSFNPIIADPKEWYGQYYKA